MILKNIIFFKIDSRLFLHSYDKRKKKEKEKKNSSLEYEI